MGNGEKYQLTLMRLVSHFHLRGKIVNPIRNSLILTALDAGFQKVGTMIAMTVCEKKLHGCQQVAREQRRTYEDF